MSLNVMATSQFRRDYRLLKKRGYDMSLLNEVLFMLADGERLPAKYSDHQLKGELKHYRECHIAPDWLLVYRIDGGNLVLVLSRTGTHDDLFGHS